MAVPSPRYFSLYATLSELPPHLLLKIDEFRDQLVFQKVLFRRGQKGVGGGWWRGEERGVKRVVMKTHSSDCVKHLGERYPEGKFVFGHRMPSKQLSSCFGLVFIFLFLFVLVINHLLPSSLPPFPSSQIIRNCRQISTWKKHHCPHPRMDQYPPCLVRKNVGG